MAATWVIGEVRDGAVKRVTDELITAARSAAPGQPVTVVLVGSDLDAAAAGLVDRGVQAVLVLDDARFGHYSPDGWARALAGLVRDAGVDLVLGPATFRGRDLLARLAAELGVELVSDVVELSLSEGRLTAVRPIYAGRALATVAASGHPIIATVRPNSYPAATPAGGTSAIERPAAQECEAASVVLDFAPAESSRPDVAEADVIVSGGRGMGAPEHFRLVEELADELRAAVGASRAVVDAGWRPHGEQVGQTGKTVSPTLYLACGISGAMQHLAGMKTAKVIVAVNKDPEAPIFAVADYGIVADLFEALPAITNALREQRRG